MLIIFKNLQILIYRLRERDRQDRARDIQGETKRERDWEGQRERERKRQNDIERDRREIERRTEIIWRRRRERKKQ